MPDLLSSLLKFAISYSGIENSKTFYHDLDSFLSSNWGCAPILIYSIPKAATYITNSKVVKHSRLLWNRDKLEAHYNLDSLQGLLDDSSLFTSSRGWHDYRASDGHYYACTMSDTAAVSVLVIFKVNTSILGEALETLDVLVSFLQGQQERMDKFYEVKKLEKLVYCDDVTPLMNRRRMIHDIEEAIKRYDMYGEEFVLFFIDVDHFKAINDQYGHLIGSKVLAALGSLLLEACRIDDLIYRYGGDEFVVLISGVSDREAREIGQRLLNVVGAKNFNIDGIVIRLTISIGIARYPRDASSCGAIISMADSMMYESKRRGRSQLRTVQSPSKYLLDS